MKSRGCHYVIVNPLFQYVIILTHYFHLRSSTPNSTSFETHVITFIYIQIKHIDHNNACGILCLNYNPIFLSQNDPPQPWNMYGDMCGPRYKSYYCSILRATCVIYLEADQSSRHTLLQSISACVRCCMAMYAS